MDTIFVKQVKEGGPAHGAGLCTGTHINIYVQLAHSHSLLGNHFTPCDKPADLVINSACLTSDLKVPFDAKISSRFYCR